MLELQFRRHSLPCYDSVEQRVPRMAAHQYVRAAGLLQQLQQIARHRMAYAELAYPTSAANEGRRTPAGHAEGRRGNSAAFIFRLTFSSLRRAQRELLR